MPLWIRQAAEDERGRSPVRSSGRHGNTTQAKMLRSGVAGPTPRSRGGGDIVGRRTKCAEEERRDATSEDPAVDHPSVLGARADAVPETAFWLFSLLLLGDSICRARPASQSPAPEDRKAGFGHVLVTGEEGPSAAELGLGWQIAGR